MDGPRGIRPGELPALLELVNAVFRPEGGDMGQQYPTLFCADNAAWLRGIWDGARPLAHVGVWRGTVESFGRRLRVAHVGAVCTHPDHRGQGLAGGLLVDAVRRLHADGTALLLISGERGLYQRLGARRFGELLSAEVTREALEAALAREAGGLAFVEPPPGNALAQAAAIDAMARLQAAEPVRYRRSLADWRALLPAKGYVPADRGRGAVVAWRGGTPVAYALFSASQTGRRPGPDAGPRPLRIDEYAGDRAAALAAVGHLLGVRGRGQAQVVVQPWDQTLRELVRCAGGAERVVQHQGTARVLHAGALLRALSGGAGPGPDIEACARLRPEAAVGTPEEAEQVAALTAAALGPGAHALPLPRTDGPNYI